jgi:hypothetical protein
LLTSRRSKFPITFSQFRNNAVNSRDESKESEGQLRLHTKAEAITPLELSFSLKSLLISNTSPTKGVTPIVLLDQGSNNYSFGKFSFSL